MPDGTQKIIVEPEMDMTDRLIVVEKMFLGAGRNIG